MYTLVLWDLVLGREILEENISKDTSDVKCRLHTQVQPGIELRWICLKKISFGHHSQSGDWRLEGKLYLWFYQAVFIESDTNMDFRSTVHYFGDTMA